jgi:hypothetical protein
VAFDPAGDMWVAEYSSSKLVEFAPSQLASSGAPTPAVTISDNGSGDLSNPWDLAFDSAGNLWVTTNNGSGGLLEYPASSLGKTGTPTPAVVITPEGSGPTVSLNQPDGLAFDSAGNLWVANFLTSTLVQFSKSQLGSSGSPTPAVELAASGSGTAASIDGPGGIAFDGAGNLWVSNGNNNSVTSFAPGLLTTSGSPAPTSALMGASTQLNGPGAVAIVPATQRATESGYWEVASDGGIFSFGNHQFYGSTGGIVLNKPIVGMAPTPVHGSTGGKGYWLVATDGGIFSFGDAQFYGSTGSINLNKPIVGMASTPDGLGYWLVASDGGIFSFGDAQFYGSTGSITLNKPIVGMAATPDGGGYWMVASDGGIFSFGDAQFYGSTGNINLNKPIVGMAATPDGKGYWMVASDGGIFSFGDANFWGSTGAIKLNQPIVGMTASADGLGYWLDASDGGIFTFGDAAFDGSMGGIKLNKPVVGMAS